MAIMLVIILGYVIWKLFVDTFIMLFRKMCGRVKGEFQEETVSNDLY
jgi:E3 ubiquitin-protein ligase DOA10